MRRLSALQLSSTCINLSLRTNYPYNFSARTSATDALPLTLLTPTHTLHVYTHATVSVYPHLGSELYGRHPSARR
jgi:hypothetical protein